MCILFARNSQIYVFNFFRFVDFNQFLSKTLIASGCLVSATPPTVLANHFETSQMFQPWYVDVHIVCL